MSWFFISTIAYFLISLEVILDKFLLSSKRVSHPSIYAFYSGVLSVFTLLLFPFGIHAISWQQFLFYIFPGFIFAYGILLIFFAFEKSEASRVTPVVGATIPIVTFFLSLIILKENFNAFEMLGIGLLISGGLVISWEWPKNEKISLFKGFYYAIAAGIILAVSFTLFKKFYETDNFINVFIWTRMGFVLGSLSLLIYPLWRKAIISSLFQFKKPEKENKRSGLIFALNKILGGSGSILLNFAISLGSVTIINALVSVEYVFIFLMGLFFSKWSPNVFQEKKDLRNIIQKVSAIIIITLGLIFVSR